MIENRVRVVRLLLAVAVAVSLPLLAGNAAPPEPPNPQAAPEPSAAPEPELLPTPAAPGETPAAPALAEDEGYADAFLPLESERMQAVCSPPPECFSDRDCNRICGKKVGGQCVWINSCTSVCYCNAS